MAKSFTSRSSYLLLSLLAGFSSTSFAGGFSLFEENVSGLGNSYAGTGAVAEDASTEFYNPAAMMLLPDPQFVLSATGINLNIKSDVSSATNTVSATFPGIGNIIVTEPVVGQNNTQAGKFLVVPAFHFVYPCDRWALGFGVTSPYGLMTVYPTDATSRFFGTESKIITINIGPNLGLQLTPQFSVGVGFDAQYLDAALDQSVAVIDPTTLTTLAEGLSKNRAFNWAYGWNTGALYQFTPCNRLGFSYRSRIDHHIDDGDITLDFPTVSVFGGTFGIISTDVVIPASANVSYYHSLNPQWELLSGLDWVHWGAIDTLTLNYTGPVNEFVQSSTVVLAFRDTWRYSFGLNYRPIPQWKLRTGVAFDESCVRSDETRTFRLPDSDRVWLSLGTQYCLNEFLTFDAGYAHLFIADSSINITQRLNGNINLPTVPVAIPYSVISMANGTFDSSIDEFGLQVTWHII